MNKELTKEECELALEEYDFRSERPLPYEYQLLRRLINEHFDNTYDFKRFKLYSKSYFKKMTKRELVDYIYLIYGNWQGTDSACNHGMKYAEELQKDFDYYKELADTHQEYLQMIINIFGMEDDTPYDAIIDEINRIAELKCKYNIAIQNMNNPPLKFEELHEGMWVWDKKNELYNLIYETRINCANEQEIEFQWQQPDIDGNYFSCDIFEENRFYRYEVKNEKQRT